MTAARGAWVPSSTLHRTAQLGKGGLETPAGGLGHRPEHGRGVAEGKLRAVDAHQAQARVEGLRLAERSGQRGKRLFQNGFKDLPGHGKTTLAGGGVADGLPGQILQVRGQGALGLTNVVNQTHEQLGAPDPGRAACQGGVCSQDVLQLLGGEQTLELGEKGVCIA